MAPKKSLAWKYFVKRNRETASCNVCFKIIKFCGNTSNLNKHLKTHNVLIEKSLTETDEDSNLNMGPTAKISKSTSGTVTTEISPGRSTIQPLDRYFSCSDPKESSEVYPSCSSTNSLSEVSKANIPRTTSGAGTTNSSCMIRQPILEAFAKLPSYQEGGKKHAAITMCLLYFICKDMRPFHIIEGEGFKQLMKELVPSYKIPSAKYIKKKLAEKYEVSVEEYKKRFGEVNELCITTDVWTETMTEKSFLGVTIHFLNGTQTVNLNLATKELKDKHTTEYLTSVLREILDDWGIPKSKVRCIVTDNGANMVGAAKAIAGERNHLPCFAHTLNLVVENATETESIQKQIVKVRTIVKWVKNSVNNSDKLRKIQNDAGVAEGAVKKLILDVRTRWNSTFYMLERFIELLKVVSEIILDSPSGPLIPTSSEIEEIKQLITLLKPFEYATREASGENYITISKVIPMMNCITSQITNFQSDIPALQEVQNLLLKEMKKRFGHIEYNTHAALATVLDPRFKNLHFQDPLACGKALTKIRELITVRSGSSSEDDVDECASINSYDFWQHHKELAHGKNKRSVSKQSDELSVYLANPVCHLKTKPLEQWEEMRFVLPGLYREARRFLLVSASSVPCERLFSKAGGTVTETRNRLSSKHLDMLLFQAGLPNDEWFK